MVLLETGAPWRATPNFVLVIDQYREMLSDFELLRTSNNSGGPRWHAGFIPPLFFVATECLDEAISYLRSLRLQEKNWNSCVAANIATRLIHLDERSAFGGDQDQEGVPLRLVSDQDVPSWAVERVSIVVDETKNALETSSLAGSQAPSYACNRNLDWQKVIYLVRRSRYQRAALPAPTDRGCSGQDMITLDAKIPVLQ